MHLLLWCSLVQHYDGIYTRSVFVRLSPSGSLVIVQRGYGMVRGTVRCDMVCGMTRYVISYVGMI